MFIRRNIAQARGEGTSAIVFDIDTFGGRVDSALQTAMLIYDLDPIESIAWVMGGGGDGGQLVGGATEETIIARVGEGIVFAIDSADSYKSVLENPDQISERVLAKGLDAETSFKILSIDIGDVGESIGAQLQADEAEADKRRFQAEAEKRRATARVEGLGRVAVPAPGRSTSHQARQ